MVNTGTYTEHKPKHTVLFIEDSQEILEDVRFILEQEGYNVITADRGRDGIQNARFHHVDLIVCDINLPDIDGMNVLVEIRSDPRLESIPFIFLSGLPGEKHAPVGEEMGADDYIEKPTQAYVLLQSIARLLSGQQRPEGPSAHN